MMSFSATQLLREHVLDGVSIVLAGATTAPADPADPGTPSDPGAPGTHASLAGELHEACAALGARVADCPLSAQGEPEHDEREIDRAVASALAELGSIEMLVVDAAGLLAAAPVAADGAGGREAMVGVLESSWAVTRAVANSAFIEQKRPGRIVYVAPPPGGGMHAEPARAGLENLSRTLSIEWARHRVTPVTIAPAERTPAVQLAALIAYLATDAGAYFSGCLLDLRGPAGASAA